MTPFGGILILEVTLTQVGTSAMWDAALRILPDEQCDQDRPVIVNVTDGKGNQIGITRINGIPTVVGSSLPQRLSAAAQSFQARWQATPIANQTVTQVIE